MKKIAILLLIAFSLNGKDYSDFDKQAYSWSRTFAEVMQLVKKKHYKVDNFEDSMIKAMDAFLGNLDPHSAVLGPKTYQSMLESTSGQFYGIGIVIDNMRKSKDKYLTVIEPIADGPAEKAGIKAMDKIIEVAGKPLEGMSTEEATSLIKGPRNTSVQIKVLRENHPDLITFDVMRDVVKEQNSMSFYIKSHDIYYISLNTFTENAVKQVEKLVKQSSQRAYKGLILDLRNNSGGLLTAAIDIASFFLDKGSLVVVTKDKNGKETERYLTKRPPIANPNIPIFILINNYTASAAEILAACLKTHADDNAKKYPDSPKSLVFVVGTKSFEKGSVQEIIPVSNNCAVKITTSLYFPNNINIQGEGITPDFLVERTFPPTEQMQWFTKYYGREQALSNHIKANKKQPETEAVASKNKPIRWVERAKEMLKTDNQLREAISLANLLQIFKNLCPDKVCNRTRAIAQLKASHIPHNALEIEEIKL